MMKKVGHQLFEPQVLAHEEHVGDAEAEHAVFEDQVNGPVHAGPSAAGAGPVAGGVREDHAHLVAAGLGAAHRPVANILMPGEWT